MKRLWIRWRIVLLVALAVPPAWADAPLRIGVLAIRSKAVTEAQWQPLAAHLSKELDAPVRVSAYEYPELNAAVAAHQLDAVLTSPGHYILLQHRYYLSAPIATQITHEGPHYLTAFGGVMFARADTDAIRDIDDFPGKRIATLDPLWFGSYQMQAYELFEAGAPLPDPRNLVITGVSQDKVVEEVLAGRADIGFVRTGQLEAMAAEGRIDFKRIKILHQQEMPSFPFISSTQLYPEWPMALLPEVDAQLARRLTVALLSLPPERVAGVGGFAIPADYREVSRVLLALRMPPFDGAQEVRLTDLWYRYAGPISIALATLVVLFGGMGAMLIVQNVEGWRRQALYRRQSQHLGEVIWGTNIGTWEWNLVSGELVVNPRWAEILGYTVAELEPLGMPTWVKLLHPDDLARSQALFAACFERRSDSYHCECRMRHKNGDWVWVLDRGRVVEWDGDGKPLRAAGTHQDITARKLGELREQHRNRILHKLTEHRPLAEILAAIAADIEHIDSAMLCKIELADSGGWSALGGTAPVAVAAGGTDTEVAPIAALDTHPLWAPFRELAHLTGSGCCWSQAIRSVRGQPIGTVQIYHRRAAAPDAADLQWIAEEARLCALAVEKSADVARLQLAASVFSHAREGIIITDARANIVEVNDAFTDIAGYAREEVIGQNPRMLHSGRHDPEFYAAMWQCLRSQGYWQGEIWNRRKSGELYAEIIAISAVRDADGTVQNYVALFTDITLMKEHQSQLEHIAHYDTLTGLPNRVLLADRLRQALIHSQRHGKSLAVVYLDLDGFKQVNDHFGHAVGDELLVSVAQRMKAVLREGDTLARMGGDEFIAVLADLEAARDCEPVLERLLQVAAEPALVCEELLHVSASIGVTIYPQDGVDADQLMRHADQAMYQAKQAGKNRYQLFDVAQDVELQSLRESQERIAAALTGGEFLMYYQPKVNMRSGRVIGAEALIRWQHPERGLLLPAEFLPVIENRPLSVTLGEWVLDTVLEQMSAWQRQGHTIAVSVNIAARQLQQDDFVERLRALLARHADVAPHLLELEVLETSALEDVLHASEVIRACNAIGVRCALDDFGTGYSSLTYLKYLPAELLKIDRSFVRDMLDDPDDLAIVDGVIGLAQAFRRNVIAEGVETVTHGELLLTLGCELAQGYGIARPMPAADVPGWIERWRPDPAWSAWRARLLSRDDLALVFAQVGHRYWLRTLDAYLAGERSSAPPMETNDCHFGRWQARAGQFRYGKLPAFRALVDLHERIHQQGAALLALHAQGQHAAARAGVAPLERLCEELIQGMRELIQLEEDNRVTIQPL